MQNKTTIETPWFYSSEEILLRLKTSTSGLTEQEAKKRLQKFGPNNFKNRTKQSILKLGVKQLMSPLIFILIMAAVLTGVLNEWANMFVIIGAILVNTSLGLYREYQAENTLEKLVTYIKDRSRVIRQGKEQEIDSSIIVPGDIIKLAYGSRIPADARIISVNNLKVDEAILTGESVPETKVSATIKESTQMADRTNMVYAGTLVVEGFAVAVVVNTGNRTEIGKIANLVSGIDRAVTPIQKGLSQLSWYIFFITLFIVALIFTLGVFRGEPIFHMLILSAAVAVGAVPEALPIALTIILSVGAERIASKKGVIRKLAAAETLGSTTIIMTDKTGTLTQANMQLVGVNSTSSIVASKHKETDLKKISPAQTQLLKLALQNIDVVVKNPTEPENKWEFIGRPLEVNIAKALGEHGIAMKKSLLSESSLHLPFNSTNKFSVSKVGKQYFLMGAPDVLLKRSNLSKTAYLKISAWIEDASNNGKRLIALGQLNSKSSKKLKLEDFQNIQFDGILSFFDPIREEVPRALKDIEQHNVTVVMITGDLKGTALSVAKSLGWDVSENEVLIGEDLHSMSDEQLLDIIGKIKIFARVTPEDKLRIGKLYIQKGDIVAMTGDGVNDAPALKAVDIGISLGSGSDVAQSAADLVLLDDNFKTISMAIDEGRRILANIRKTFIYLLSNSLDAVFIVGGSLILNAPLPITALQIIWVNLFTGSLPALAFAYDENLDRGFGKKTFKKELLTSEVKILSFGLGIMSSVLIFALYYVLLQFNLDLKVIKSVFFVCFTVYILAISFSFKSLYRSIFSYNPFSNKKLNYAVLLGLAILTATMSIPFMRDLFDIAPMPLKWLWLVVGWCVLNVALVELVKFAFRYRLNRKT